MNGSRPLWGHITSEYTSPVTIVKLLNSASLWRMLVSSTLNFSFLCFRLTISFMFTSFLQEMYTVNQVSPYWVMITFHLLMVISVGIFRYSIIVHHIDKIFDMFSQMTGCDHCVYTLLYCSWYWITTRFPLFLRSWGNSAHPYKKVKKGKKVGKIKSSYRTVERKEWEGKMEPCCKGYWISSQADSSYWIRKSLNQLE